MRQDKISKYTGQRKPCKCFVYFYIGFSID